MATAFVGLGSNLGNRALHLDRALLHLSRLPKTRLLARSRWHETAPMGGPPQGPYLNGVAQIETQLMPEELLAHLKELERALGRKPSEERWGPRVIDLDLLSCDDLILKTEALTLPHPHLHERLFVLDPLAEIAPGWIHPVLKKSARSLREEFLHADCKTPAVS